MYKVLIADDEFKVCQLIQYLVSWEKLGLEVVACVNDGGSALNIIQDIHPDIVITDIRMPGYNGIEMIKNARSINPNIEFIIISGYKNFDYAHDAIKLGVYDYLLKPLRKSELENTLTKIAAKLDIKNWRADELTDIRERLDKNRLKLNSAFVKDCFLMTDSDTVSMTIEQINLEYQLNFINGQFQVLLIKVDLGYKENNENLRGLITEKCLKIIENHLKAVCHEMAIHSSGTNIFCIINYIDMAEQNIRKVIKAMLDNITSLDELFLNFAATVGVGQVVSNLNQLADSLKGAQIAINSRITLGTGRIIESSKLGQVDNGLVREKLLPPHMSKSFAGYISALDREGIINWFEKFYENTESLNEHDGNAVLSVCVEIVDMYLFNLRKEKLDVHGKTDFLSTFGDRFHKCSSVKELVEMLSELILSQIESILDERHFIETKPIRMAKEYIQQNYYTSLTLEEVSSFVGFNPTYFSHIFKKITGMNFLEYVTEIRIEKAKELLISSDQTISDLGIMVGYEDIKHFSKLFKKITGLSPSEYRKFYQ